MIVPEPTAHPPAGGRGPAIPEINGLRGIAILAVIWGHAFSPLIANMNFTVFNIWLTPYVLVGWHGVNLFFVLSAFVLYLPYVAGARDIAARGAVWRFYKARALRLLPAYYLIVVAQMAFPVFNRMPFENWHATRQTLAMLSFSFPFLPDLWMPAEVNGVVWSLGTEVLFSAAFPLLCWLCLRYGAARILAVSIPVGLLSRFGGFAVAPLEPVSWMEALAIGRIDEFLWGFLLAEMFARGRIPARPGLLWAGGMALLLVTTNAYGGLDLLGPHFKLYMTVLIVPLDVALALLVAAALAGRSRWSAFLNMRWLRVAGMACYSIYLWHYPLLYSFSIPPDPGNVPNLVGFAVCLCILAGITYRFVEFRGVADWRSLFLLDETRGARLNRTIDPAHPLVRLAGRIDWRSLDRRLGGAYFDRPGQSPLPVRLMAGLAILGPMHGLSDEALFERWLENPYDQWFCGEDVFRHQLPLERSALPRWRRHVGEAALAAVLRDVLALADPAPDAIVDRGRHDAPALEPVRLV